MDVVRTHTTKVNPAYRHAASAGVALLLLAGIGMARIVSTYRVFSQTCDEPAHVATGMEWLERGTYTFEPLHPPLARVAAALGPYLSGLRLTGQGDMWKEGNEILFARGRYLHNLALARLGALPFFLLATFLVWRWARVRYGEAPALVAALLFTTSPVVLAHAGLATTDMAVTATFTGALLAYVNLLERPTYLRFAVLGLAAGLATLSKFSALVFMPASGLALLVWRRLLATPQKEKTVVTDPFRWGTDLTLAALALFAVVWGAYRFSVGSVTDAAARPHPTLDHVFGYRGTLHDWAYSVAESPRVPAPAFFRGLLVVRRMEAYGRKGYLLGHIGERLVVLLSCGIGREDDSSALGSPRAGNLLPRNVCVGGEELDCGGACGRSPCAPSGLYAQPDQQRSPPNSPYLSAIRYHRRRRRLAALDRRRAEIRQNCSRPRSPCVAPCLIDPCPS